MGFFDILGAFVPLIIIVALLYGVLVFVRKYGYNLRGKEFSAIDIKVVSTKMIMPKKYVSVIKVDDKFLVVGISENSINLLKELDDTDLYLTPAEDQIQIPAGKGGSFFDIMKKNLGMK